MTMSVKERLDYVFKEIDEVSAIMSTKPGFGTMVKNKVFRKLVRGNMYIVTVFDNDRERGRKEEMAACRFLAFIRSREYERKEQRLVGITRDVLDVVSAMMRENGV